MYLYDGSYSTSTYSFVENESRWKVTCTTPSELASEPFNLSHLIWGTFLFHPVIRESSINWYPDTENQVGDKLQHVWTEVSDNWRIYCSGLSDCMSDDGPINEREIWNEALAVTGLVIINMVVCKYLFYVNISIVLYIVIC